MIDFNYAHDAVFTEMYIHWMLTKQVFVVRGLLAGKRYLPLNPVNVTQPVNNTDVDSETAINICLARHAGSTRRVT